MQKWRYLPAIIIFLLVYSSCKKDKDVSDPVVVINAPYENQQFNVFDEMTVNAVVSDDRKLDYVMVVLEDQNFIPVLKSYTFTPDNSTFELDMSYKLDDIHLPSGDYYLLVKASDGINEKSKFVKVSITAVPKKLECIYVTESMSGNVLLQRIDSANVVTTVLTRPPDYSASAVSSDYRLLLICGKYSENLTAFNVTTMQPEWYVNVLNSPPFPYFENMVYDNGKLFVGYHEGRWAYFDLNGFSMRSKVTDQNWIPKQFLVQDDFLITYQQQLSGLNNKLVVYYLNSTEARQDYQVDLEVVKMFNQVADQYLAFGNFLGQGYLQLHDISNGYLYDPVTMPSGSITSVERISDKDYVIALGNTILVYDDDASTVNTFISGISASLVRYEPLSGRLYVVPQTGGNIIKMYSWPGGQYLGAVSTDGNASEILFQYNRE